MNVFQELEAAVVSTFVLYVMAGVYKLARPFVLDTEK